MHYHKTNESSFGLAGRLGCYDTDQDNGWTLLRLEGVEMFAFSEWGRCGNGEET